MRRFRKTTERNSCALECPNIITALETSTSAPGIAHINSLFHLALVYPTRPETSWAKMEQELVHKKLPVCKVVVIFLVLLEVFLCKTGN